MRIHHNLGSPRILDKERPFGKVAGPEKDTVMAENLLIEFEDVNERLAGDMASRLQEWLQKDAPDVDPEMQKDGEA